MLIPRNLRYLLRKAVGILEVIPPSPWSEVRKSLRQVQTHMGLQIEFLREIIVGHENGSASAWDEYGRKSQAGAARIQRRTAPARAGAPNL